LPLSKRARVEIYIPSGARFGRLRTVLERELIYAFGGCTVVSGIKGQYLAADGTREAEPIDLVYADAPFDFDENFQTLSDYADDLKRVALKTTSEESILIVVQEVYHSV
jgi:hypothetical protein